MLNFYSQSHRKPHTNFIYYNGTPWVLPNLKKKINKANLPDLNQHSHFWLNIYGSAGLGLVNLYFVLFKVMLDGTQKVPLYHVKFAVWNVTVDKY